ncbi:MULTISPECIES: GNAT family N-acetyltransferase [Acinetobacter]|jgi:N-acetylglutamate synthase and related acetyltransferases|uniref:GNAT family N-acetyltransferase n=1 Tax=Acinetobacter variabilis TaxID=70346 RepID=A0A3R9ABV1_9GAMM|nr:MULTISPECIES: GNAT family N-acetyltransferase [Acinetobacter]EXA67711.1 acetyltransferase family protein [Acinetobacter baumannii 348935]AUX89668.1 N-acetyltransferase [Acinetobacter sp. ACNIH1]MBO3659688.1 GNAT family N-acetyltransferase [Acinetobacter variabilis]MCU4313058.1 GNAT family N-acetyltransferase [Acinetobacter variabilis]MCU4630487.1 GNAT family N-acetyltransferase [Acinetobacter variabilis]
MDIKIVTAEQLPDQIDTLATLARKEGYDLIDKLIEEYRTGKNCFSQNNEFLACAYDGNKLIACGGLNQQWGDNGIEERIGRVRRFYVHPKYRQHGVGKQLLAYLEQLARPFYSALCLQTDTKLAASFYQKQNYVFVENHPSYNYFKYMI